MDVAGPRTTKEIMKTISFTPGHETGVHLPSQDRAQPQLYSPVALLVLCEPRRFVSQRHMNSHNSASIPQFGTKTSQFASLSFRQAKGLRMLWGGPFAFIDHRNQGALKNIQQVSEMVTEEVLEFRMGPEPASRERKSGTKAQW